MKRPYIGVTGFNDKLDILIAEREFEKRKKIYEDSVDQDSDRILMAGVLVSLKTIYGIKNEKHPSRYPDLDKIRRIFCDGSALKIIHYHTHLHSEKFFVELMFLREIAGPNLDGFQLNMVWPNHLELAAYKNKYPTSKIILQVDKKALKEVCWIPGLTDGSLICRLKRYANLIDYLLLDQSQGRGIPFCGNSALQQLRIAREALPDVGLVVAGGLGPGTVHFVKKPLEESSDLSWDAETNIRDENDYLSLDKMSQYFGESFNILSTSPDTEKDQYRYLQRISYSTSRKKPLSLITADDIPPGLEPEDVALLDED